MSKLGTYLRRRRFPQAGFANGAWVTHDGNLHLYDSSLREDLKFVLVSGDRISYVDPELDHKDLDFRPKTTAPSFLNSRR